MVSSFFVGLLIDFCFDRTGSDWVLVFIGSCQLLVIVAW
jgi:hypothetical protein